MCREHVVQLCDHQKEIEALNTTVLLVSFSERRWVEGWLREATVPFPVLIDEECKVYKSYGLRSPKASVFHPNVTWEYIKLMLRGKMPKKPRGNPYQLGGDFIIDRKGIVRFAHPSKNPTDRAEVGEILAALKQLS